MNSFQTGAIGRILITLALNFSSLCRFFIYFPIQKAEKMLPNNSSTSIANAPQNKNEMSQAPDNDLDDDIPF